LNDNEDNVVLLEMIDGDEKVEEPKTSIIFTSVDEVISYYRKFAKQSGFGVLTRTAKKKKMFIQDIKSLHVVVKAETELTQVMLRSQLQRLLEQGVMLGFVHRHV